MSRTSFKTEQNALSTAAELILTANSGRRFVEVKNLDASIAVYLGPTSSVTSSNGHKVEAGTSFAFEDYDGEIWAVAGSGTPTVAIICW